MYKPYNLHKIMKHSQRCSDENNSFFQNFIDCIKNEQSLQKVSSSSQIKSTIIKQSLQEDK